MIAVLLEEESVGKYCQQLMHCKIAVITNIEDLKTPENFHLIREAFIVIGKWVCLLGITIYYLQNTLGKIYSEICCLIVHFHALLLNRLSPITLNIKTST